MLITHLDITLLHTDYWEIHYRAINHIDIANHTIAAMTGFLDLSREIRDMIYALALVVEDVIVPYSEFYPLSDEELSFRKNMPTTGLLGVNKLIGAEAAEVFYGKNTWRITSDFPGAARHVFFKRQRHLFRRVVIVFSQGNVDPRGLHNRTESEYEDQEAQDSPEVDYTI